MAQKPSVLIVGDDTSDRGELYDLLNAQGYSPATASTCEQALNLVRRSPPAVAIVYLWLSDLPGHVVIHGIRQASPNTECIALVTSPTQQEAAYESMRTGAFAFLRRAYDSEQQLAIIKRAVEKHETTQALSDVKERLAILFDSLPAGVLIVDARTRAVVDANPEAVRIIGMPKDDIIGSLCRSRTMVGSSTNTPSDTPTETTGCVIPATRTVAEIMLGGRKHFVEGFVDVTGKLLIEDQMYEQQALAKLLMDNVQDVVMIVGPDRKITGIADGVETLDHRARAGADSLALIPSSCRDRYRRGLDRAFEHAESEAFSQGSPPLESWSIRMDPVRSRGEVIAVAVRVRDLNARERGVEKLAFRGAAIEKSAEALLTINAEGVVVDANPAACDLLEYLPGEIIGLAFSQLDVDTKTRWDDHFRKMSLDEQLQYEATFRTRNGHAIPVSVFANYAMIEGTAMCFAFIENISGKRNLDDVVHSIASKENTYLAAIRDEAVVIDRDGRIINLNDVAAKRFGGNVESIKGSNYYRLTPEVAARFRKGRIDEVFVRDREIRFEDRVGKAILEHTVCPVRDHNNLITQVLIVTRDITQHRVQWARIEGIWNAGNIPLFEFDFSKLRRDISEIAAEGNPAAYIRKQTDVVRQCISKIVIRDINPRALELLGLESAEDVYDHAEGVFTPTGAVQMVGGLVTLFSESSVVDFEQQFRTPDGQTAKAMLRLIVHHGPADEWHHVLGVLVDVSALRNVQERLVDASLRERARIADEVSRTVGATMQSSVALGEKLEKGLAKTKSPYAEHAEELQAQLAEVKEKLDLILSGVEAEGAGADTLINSLRQLGDHTKLRHGIECTCNLSAVGLMRDRHLAGHLFHIAREAVDYAVRRHQPSEISITITAANKGGVLVVRDDGNGTGEVDEDDVAVILMRTHAALIEAELGSEKSRQHGNEQSCVFQAPVS